MKSLSRNLSIKKKNLTVIFTVLLFAVFTTLVMLLIQAVKVSKDHLATEIDSLAQILGKEAKLAVELGAKDGCEQVLVGLRAVPEVIGAEIYNRHGAVLATYRKDPTAAIPFKSGFSGNRLFEGGILYGKREIEQNGEKIGKLLIVATTGPLKRQINGYILFTLGVLLIVFPIALLLGNRLSRHLTAPILALSRAAAAVSSQDDYSIRVNRINKDEIGILYDSFNQMLKNIAAKNLAYQKLNESLEEKVEERTMALSKAKEQAESAARLKSTFLANMSHEIRTPMNSILGYSRILARMVTDGQQKKYLDVIQSNGRALLALIDDILELSKIEAGKINLKIRPLNLKVLLHEIKDSFIVKTREKGIDFLLQIDPSLPETLMMDETRMREILFNVVGNAVKFTDQGHVKLSVSKGGKETASKIGLVFQVEDTGIGISRDQKEIIFEAFEQQYQQANEYGGTGLGLPITRYLVQMMKGKIEVTSKTARGSTFTIFIPDVEISPTQLRTGQPLVTLRDLPRFEEAVILVVEDNRHNMELVKAILADQDIRIIEAEDGIQALQKTLDYRPDLILMDLKLPKMSGYEVIRRLKAHDDLKDIPVIALTADVMGNSEKKIIAGGCSGFLPKPLDEDQFFVELMKHLPFRKNDSPAPTRKEDDWLTAVKRDFQALAPTTYRDVAEIMSQTMMEKWQDLGDSLLLDDWMSFGEQILQLGESYKIDVLVHYGRHIIENVQNLDIVELKKTIKSYPLFVDMVKSQGGSHE